MLLIRLASSCPIHQAFRDSSGLRRPALKLKFLNSQDLPEFVLQFCPSEIDS